ncbi:MAG: serine/threonine-protein kinase [Opitutus sp.]
MKSAPTCQMCGATIAADGPCAACMLRTGLSHSGDPTNAPETTSTLPRSFGAYELLEEIARGGMGIVYRARQHGLNRMVALKVLIGGAYSSESLVRRFQIEAESAAGLQHPGLVTIHEFGEFDHQPYYTMDYVKGRNLSEIVAGQPLAPARAARYLQEISAAVQFAHEQGILHRDLKPSNVLIDESDHTRVTDFGLAKKLAGSADVTLAGQMIGSPNYASPEQALGGEARLGVTGDIYSLGALLYCLLTSRPPFLASTIEETLRLVAAEEPVSPRALNPAVPRDLETICLKCLEKDPARRYASAELLGQELARYREGLPILARPVSKFEHAWRWGRHHPAVAALAATVVLALTATSTVFYISARRVQRSRELELIALATARANLYAINMQTSAVGFAAAGGYDPISLRSALEESRPTPGSIDLRGFEWRLYWQMSQNEAVTTLKGHQQVVDAVRYSPDGSQVATHALNGTLKFWDPRSGRELQSVEGVAVPGGFDSTASHFVFSRPDQSIWQVTLSTGQLEQRTNPVGPLIGMHDDGSVVVFGPNQRPVLQELSLTAAPAGGEAVTPNTRSSISLDRRRVAVAGRQYPGILVIDVATGREVTSLIDPRPVIGITLSPDGDHLVSAGFDGVLKIWDVKRGTLEQSFRAFLDPVWGLAYSADGKLFAAGGNNRTLKVWNTSDWSLLASRTGHTSTIHAIAFAPDGNHWVSGAEDELALVWSAQTHRLPLEAPRLLRGPAWGDPIPSLAFSPDSRVFAGTAADGTIKIWRSDNFEIEASFPAIVRTVAFSTDGRFVLGEGYDGSVRQWDRQASNDGLLLSPKADYANWQTAPLSPAERVELVADQAGTRAASGLCSIPSTRDAINSGAMMSASAIAMSADGKTMCLGLPRGDVEVWDMASRKKRLSFSAHKLSVCSIVISNDGRHLATGSLDNTTKLWDAATGEAIATIHAHNRPVWALAFSPDGQTLAAGSCDKAIVLVSVSLKRMVANLPLYVGLPQGYEQEVRVLRFSPDGNILAAGLGDGTVRLFRAAPFSETDAPAQTAKPVASL